MYRFGHQYDHIFVKISESLVSMGFNQLKFAFTMQEPLLDSVCVADIENEEVNCQKWDNVIDDKCIDHMSHFPWYTCSA